MSFLYGAGRLGERPQGQETSLETRRCCMSVARCCCLKLGNDDNVVGQSVRGGGALGFLAERVTEPRVRQHLSGARSSRRVLRQAGGNDLLGIR